MTSGVSRMAGLGDRARTPMTSPATSWTVGGRAAMAAWSRACTASCTRANGTVRGSSFRLACNRSIAWSRAISPNTTAGSAMAGKVTVASSRKTGREQDGRLRVRRVDAEAAQDGDQWHDRLHLRQERPPRAERDIRLGRQRGISLGGEHALGRRLGDDVDLIVQRRQRLPIGFGFGRDPDCGSGVQHCLQVRQAEVQRGDDPRQHRQLHGQRHVQPEFGLAGQLRLDQAGDDGERHGRNRRRRDVDVEPGRIRVPCGRWQPPGGQPGAERGDEPRLRRCCQVEAGRGGNVEGGPRRHARPGTQAEALLHRCNGLLAEASHAGLLPPTAPRPVSFLPGRSLQIRRLSAL